MAETQYILDYFARNRQLNAASWLVLIEHYQGDIDSAQKESQVYGTARDFYGYVEEGFNQATEPELDEIIYGIDALLTADMKLKNLSHEVKREARYIQKQLTDNKEEENNPEIEPEPERKRKTISIGTRIYNFLFKRTRTARNNSLSYLQRKQKSLHHYN